VQIYVGQAFVSVEVYVHRSTRYKVCRLIEKYFFLKCVHKYTEGKHMCLWKCMSIDQEGTRCVAQKNTVWHDELTCVT